MKAEELLLDAIRSAQSKGVKITCGPVFDWSGPESWRSTYVPTKRDLPFACNAIGAVLLFLGKENLAGPNDSYFAPDWQKNVEEYLEQNNFWIWCFNRGFDGGCEVTLMVEDENGKKKIRKDDASTLGVNLRRKFVFPKKAKV